MAEACQDLLVLWHTHKQCCQPMCNQRMATCVSVCTLCCTTCVQGTNSPQGEPAANSSSPINAPPAAGNNTTSADEVPSGPSTRPDEGETPIPRPANATGPEELLEPMDNTTTDPYAFIPHSNTGLHGDNFASSPAPRNTAAPASPGTAAADTLLPPGYAGPYYMAMAGNAAAYPDFSQPDTQAKVAQALHSALGLGSSYNISNFKVWLASITALPSPTGSARHLLQQDTVPVPAELLVLGFALAQQASLPDEASLTRLVQDRSTVQQLAAQLAEAGLFAPQYADSVAVGLLVAANVTDAVQKAADTSAFVPIGKWHAGVCSSPASGGL